MGLHFPSDCKQGYCNDCELEEDDDRTEIIQIDPNATPMTVAFFRLADHA